MFNVMLQFYFLSWYLELGKDQTDEWPWLTVLMNLNITLRSVRLLRVCYNEAHPDFADYGLAVVEHPQVKR